MKIFKISIICTLLCVVLYGVCYKIMGFEPTVIICLSTIIGHDIAGKINNRNN